MIFAPNWGITKFAIESFLFLLIFLLAFGYLLVYNFQLTAGNFTSLLGIERHFRNRKILLAYWLQYLALNLVLGSWEWADAHKHGLSHLVLVPCLFITFFVGPLGLIAYIAFKVLFFGLPIY